MAARAVALVAAAAAVLGWDEACLSECQPGPFNPYPTGRTIDGRSVCPLSAYAASTAGYVVSITAASGSGCPGTCSPVTEVSECENAAAWLRLGMDGEAGPCPSTSELVGPGGLWTALEANDNTHIGGCSWRPQGVSSKLTFNANASSAKGADLVDDWLVCRCADLMDLPKYVTVVSGSFCPDEERQAAQNTRPHCGLLTTERLCEEAASASFLNLPDQSLLMCTSGCGTANAVMNYSVNSAEIGMHRPGGCHYRYHPNISDDHLWFNPHYNPAAPATARTAGSGEKPDYLICGCGEIAQYAAYGPPRGSCGFVDNKGHSLACGTGQRCAPFGAGGDFKCTCEYNKDASTGQEVYAINRPAECSPELVPLKYISWVGGAECPWDAEAQCLPPPTKERCEYAALALGLVDPDRRASLPHSRQRAEQSPRGCHFEGSLSTRSWLWWNPGPANGASATMNDTLICECRRYPMYIPRLAGTGCPVNACRNVRTPFECAVAADQTGTPAPTHLQMAAWGTTMCTPDPAAGDGSPWVPCGSPGVDCSIPGSTRPCKWIDGMYAMINQTKLEDNPFGCHYHSAGPSGAQMWWSNESMGSGESVGAHYDVHFCDCADESRPDIIARALGFGHLGAGDCANGLASEGADCSSGDCVDVGGVKLQRAARYSCIGLPQQRCHADDVCTWNQSSQACQWGENTVPSQAEVTTLFSDCLELCLLLSNCSGVSFFSRDGAPPGSIGGCDFFRGQMTGGTGESVRKQGTCQSCTEKVSGSWNCYANTLEQAPAPTPVPSYNCPKCNMIPTVNECRNTHGCAWSGADYCCCDPFVSQCTHSWHTHTNTQATCEAQMDEGRACKWVAEAPQPVCELPVSQCVDIYVDLSVSGSSDPSTQDSLCVELVEWVKNNLGVSGVAAGCGPGCSFSATGGAVGVTFGLDLTGNRSCGEADRAAAVMAAAAADAVGTGAAQLTSGREVLNHHIRSKCWEDCQKDPKCRDSTPVPTASPIAVTGAPVEWTNPPFPDLTFPPVPAPVTGAPMPPQTSGCPIGVNSTDPRYLDNCQCEVFQNVSNPWIDGPRLAYCDTKPAQWSRALHYTCHHCQASGLEHIVTCPRAWKTCEILLLHYHCPGCSSKVNGNFPASMIGEDWTSSSCAPSFCDTDANGTAQGEPYPMVSYHKQIPGGNREVLPETATDPTMYYAVLVMEGVVCGEQTTAAGCAKGLCKWEGSVCRQSWCERRHRTDAPAPPAGTVSPAGTESPGTPPPTASPTNGTASPADGTTTGGSSTGGGGGGVHPCTFNCAPGAREMRCPAVSQSR
eukprot:TRINITY_DN59962_c0_g1_i1.p1 TRINITY_DN59962_c0_g1~~TRINITY_DN59962_c0_g1_i1.p1  ORF type:complete len:1302 (+),score=343.33 TRINITY_DN59962_c0_g1_i1:104-4009(+)